MKCIRISRGYVSITRRKSRGVSKKVFSISSVNSSATAPSLSKNELIVISRFSSVGDIFGLASATVFMLVTDNVTVRIRDIAASINLLFIRKYLTIIILNF